MNDQRFSGFSYRMYTDIVFGKGVEAKAAEMIKKYGGTKVLIVYGGGSVKRIGLYDTLVKVLKDGGLPFVELSGVKPNPLRSMVDRGYKLAVDEGVDFLLAVGGGSVIDTCKGIGLAMANGGDYWRFYNGTVAEKMSPVGTIHTISAAGSETSVSSVLVDDATLLKRSLKWAVCRPVFALMNPELTYSVSPYQTAVGAVDILAHTVSRYFSLHESHLGDGFGEATMRTVIKYAAIALKYPDDYEARAELMLAGSMSHNDITGIGRSAPSGGEHAFERNISAHYDTPHGAGLAVIMPFWLEYILDNCSEAHAERIAHFAIHVFDVYPSFGDTKTVAREGLRRFRTWLSVIGMPKTLAELGIPRGDLRDIIDRCVNTQPNGLVNGFAKLDKNDIAAIYTAAMGDA